MLKPSKYFRVSITTRCNLSCFFCHREGSTGISEEELSPAALELACVAARLEGFEKFKLTGGEPLVRRDICEIVARLAAMELPDFSMITNGTLLVDYAAALWGAGLRRLNVTLNTLDERRFQQLQAGQRVPLARVLDGIAAARRAGFQNIKINFVYLGSESDADLDALLQYSADEGHILVVLPLLGISVSNPLDLLYKKLGTYGIIEETPQIDAEGIRRRLLRLFGGARVLLRMDALSQCKPYKFCDQCDTKEACQEGIFPIRLSAYGELIPCMANATHRRSVKEQLAVGDLEDVRQLLSEIRGWYRVKP